MTVEEINRKINTLKEERANATGRETEVYARIVGYYRSVRNWNKGKKEEYGDRVNFSEISGADYKPAIKQEAEITALSTQPELFSGENKPSETVSYIYFYQDNCPNCPPVSAWIDKLEMKGRKINVEKQSGMDEALKLDIMSTPTVIFLDKNGIETGRGSTVSALSEILEPQAQVVGA